MSRWKELPDELDPRGRQLVARLRRLKDHSGLTMPQLAAKTGYSPKSWERYLGGRSLPPRDAVESLARIAGDDPTRLLALHEIAAEAWRAGRDSASARESAEAEPEILSAGTARFPGRPLSKPLLAGVTALLLAVASVVLLGVRLHDGDGEAAATPLASSASRSAPTYTCRTERIDGRWYTGNSRTEDAILMAGWAGREVAEAQCLLRRAGLAPGDIDGIYGPLTERAVKQVQKRAGLVVDGIVGPHTWKVLRR